MVRLVLILEMEALTPVRGLVMREPGLELRLGRAGAQKTELRLENGLGIFAWAGARAEPGRAGPSRAWSRVSASD